jgi:protoheme IX farnesyltransferase
MSKNLPGPLRYLPELVALAKPGVTLLVIITTVGGLWLAPGRLSLSTLVAALVGTVLVVASANTFNCYLERESDKYMQRTRLRPLPAGRIPPRIALIHGFVLAAISLPALWFGVNVTTGLLAMLALVSYVAVYTPLKRIGPVALLVGSVPGAMPPLMGWSAVTGGTELPGLVLFGILYVWQIPHFLAISIYRAAEYQRAGLRTLPLVRGVRVAKWHALFWSIVLVPVTLALFPLGLAGPIYLTVAGALGLGFVLYAVAGLRSAADEVWARKYFLYTLVYLMTLFAALVVDAGPAHAR